MHSQYHERSVEVTRGRGAGRGAGRGSGPPARASGFNNGVTIMVSSDEFRILELLRRYQIDSALLNEMIQARRESQYEESGVNVNGSSVMPFASHFQINGGNFMAGQEQRILSIRGRNGVQGRNEAQFQTLTQTQAAVRAIDQRQHWDHNSESSRSGGFLEAPNSYATPIAAQLARAPESQYSRNPYRDDLISASTGAHINRMNPSLDTMRHGTSRPININGPNVLANASHFEFGEGASLEPGALSAVENQTIYEQESEYS